MTDANPDLVDQIAILRKVFDLIPENTIITDPDGHIIYANPIVYRKTGFSEADVVGQNPGKLWGGHMPLEFYAEMWDTIKNKKRAWSGEIKNLTKDGEEFWVKLQISPVLGDDGEILFFLALEPDITERKKMAESLNDKADFLEKMSHLMVARELKMVSLKEEIDTLESHLSKN